MTARKVSRKKVRRKVKKSPVLNRKLIWAVIILCNIWSAGILAYLWFDSAPSKKASIYVTQTEKSADQIDWSKASYLSGDKLPSNTVYLTFDDGPADWTSDILDILQKENIKAAFFISAFAFQPDKMFEDRFLEYSSTLQRIVKEGHLLGNHTLTHADFLNCSDEKIQREIEENQRRLENALGMPAPFMHLIRPPFGSPYHDDAPLHQRERISKVIKKCGTLMMWTQRFDSTDSHEWAHGEWYEKGGRVDKDSSEYKEKMQRIFRRLVNRADGHGIIILMHDSHPTSADILPELINSLRQKGYQFQDLSHFARWKMRQGYDLVN